jgi:hypothetical protein
MKEDEALESYRYAAIELLTEAYTADQLEMEEFERRIAQVHNAVEPGEIHDAVADFPEPRTEGAHVASEEEDLDVAEMGQPVLSILSERRLSGDWLNGSSARSISILGSSRLDLRDTALEEPVISVHVVAVMGETRIIVPPDMRVENLVTPVLAEVSVRAARKRSTKRRTLRLSGFAVMGEVRVEVR